MKTETQEEKEEKEKQETKPDMMQKQDPKDDDVLNILMIGNSYCYYYVEELYGMAEAAGIEMLVCNAYYSGCPLSKHVKFLQNDSPEYILYVSSTETPDRPPEGMEGYTMYNALKFDYWDVIVMQSGGSEARDGVGLVNGNLQTIQKYVNENKKNPNAVFMWHQAWASATDPDLQRESGAKTYEQYDNDRRKMFAASMDGVRKFIVPDETFAAVIPAGTAVENAISSYLTEKDLLCDYAHAGDLGRLIAAYTYFCVLTGVEKLEEIKVDAIPKRFVKTSVVAGDRVLTEDEKALILESVNNALANPLQVTESQYKDTPAGYVRVEQHDG
jgi:hypothetical protein